MAAISHDEAWWAGPLGLVVGRSSKCTTPLSSPPMAVQCSRLDEVYSASYQALQYLPYPICNMM